MCYDIYDCYVLCLMVLIIVMFYDIHDSYHIIILYMLCVMILTIVMRCGGANSVIVL